MSELDVMRVPGGRVIFVPGPGVATITAAQMFSTNLTLAHFRGGRQIDEIDLGDGLVTTAGVVLLAQDWTSATACLKLMNYHDFGTGTTAAVIADTALETPATSIRAARGVGTQTNPSSGVYKTVSTVSFTGSGAITEWGLFSAATAGTLWDHRIFTVVNVVDLDAIQARYSLTPAAGG